MLEIPTCPIADRQLSSGSLLAAEVEVERVALADGVEQGAELRRRGRVRPGAPAAPEEDPGVEPPAHVSQRAWPGDRARWARLVGRHFPPAPVPSWRRGRSVPQAPAWRGAARS